MIVNENLEPEMMLAGDLKDLLESRYWDLMRQMLLIRKQRHLLAMARNTEPSIHQRILGKVMEIDEILLLQKQYEQDYM